MATLNPYLTFPGTAREAMEFYRSALGGELSVSTFAEMGDPGNEGVMHSRLDTLTGLSLMASDMAPGTEGTPAIGDAITLSISGGPDDDLHGCFERLAEGGQVTMPLERQMWGDDLGMLVDRYGMPWMVNIAGEQS